MNQAVDFELFLYADDSSLVYLQKEAKERKLNLSKSFCNICDWFVDVELTIYFGDDKIKNIKCLFLLL